MRGLFQIKQAEELLDAEFIGKWQDRKTLDPFTWVVLETILRQLIDNGRPVGVEEVGALLTGHSRQRVWRAVGRLDEKDLVLVQGGRVILAYPFAGTATPYKVVLPDGKERYAVCAIDALGVPAMLGQPVVICSRCHHCGDALEIPARPDGPTGGEGILVWVGERGDIRQKGYSSL